MADCIFCAIIAGEAKSWRVCEDDAAVAFLDRGQATPGHTLIVPRHHASDLWALTADEAAEVMRTVHAVAHLLRERLVPSGLNVTQSNGPWRPTRPTEAALDVVLARITN